MMFFFDCKQGIFYLNTASNKLIDFLACSEAHSVLLQMDRSEKSRLKAFKKQQLLLNPKPAEKKITSGLYVQRRSHNENLLNLYVDLKALPD